MVVGLLWVSDLPSPPPRSFPSLCSMDCTYCKTLFFPGNGYLVVSGSPPTPSFCFTDLLGRPFSMKCSLCLPFSFPPSALGRSAVLSCRFSVRCVGSFFYFCLFSHFYFFFFFFFFYFFFLFSSFVFLSFGFLFVSMYTL